MSASLQREALRSPLPGGRAAASRRAALQQRMVHTHPQALPRIPGQEPQQQQQQQQLRLAGQGSRCWVASASAGAVRAAGALDQPREGPSGGRGGPMSPILTPLPLRRPSTAAPRLAGAARTGRVPQGPSR